MQFLNQSTNGYLKSLCFVFLLLFSINKITFTITKFSSSFSINFFLFTEEHLAPSSSYIYTSRPSSPFYHVKCSHNFISFLCSPFYHFPSSSTVCQFPMTIRSTLDHNCRPDKMCHCYRRPIRSALDPVHTFRCTVRMATLCICGRWFERRFRLRAAIGRGHPGKKAFRF